jgi:hypothetical protein
MSTYSQSGKLSYSSLPFIPIKFPSKSYSFAYTRESVEIFSEIIDDGYRDD